MSMSWVFFSPYLFHVSFFKWLMCWWLLMFCCYVIVSNFNVMWLLSFLYNYFSYWLCLRYLMCFVLWLVILWYVIMSLFVSYVLFISYIAFLPLWFILYVYLIYWVEMEIIYCWVSKGFHFILLYCDFWFRKGSDESFYSFIWSLEGILDGSYCWKFWWRNLFSWRII